MLLALALALPGPRRSLVQVSALAAAVTIAVQLPAVHWFYYYIVWFMPFLLVALLGNHRGDRVSSAPAPPLARREADEAERELTLAGP